MFIVESAFASPRPLAVGVAYHRPGAPVVPSVRVHVGIDAVLLHDQLTAKFFFILMQLESGRLVEQKFVVAVLVATHITSDCLLGEAIAAQCIIDRRRIEAQTCPLLNAFATT